MNLEKLLAKARKPQPFLLVLSAPSGGGKSTVCDLLLKRLPWMRRCVTATTRAPRGRERDGRDYHFLSEEEFARRVSEKGFYEHARVHGNRYGTPKKEVEEALAKGRNLALVIDVQGGAAVKRRRKDSVLVFLAPPSMAVLKRRLEGRGTDSPESVARRLKEADAECAAGLKYDYLIINDDLETTVEALAQVCQAARHRLAR
jgi:guanylate kinase